MSAAVKKIKIRTSVAEDFGIGSLEVTVQMEEIPVKKNIGVENRGEFFVHSENDAVYLWAQLTDREGAETDRIFPVPAEGEVQFCMQAAAPVLWNAEDPYLYELVLELRDKEGRLLGCVGKKIAFYRWDMRDGAYVLNGKGIKWRIFPWENSKYFRETEQEDGIKSLLTECRKQFCNTLILPKEKRTEIMHESCLEYGIYLLHQEELVLDTQNPGIDGALLQAVDAARCVLENTENPDFELSVSNQGVLIENKSTFINADHYELVYQVRKEGGEPSVSVRPDWDGAPGKQSGGVLVSERILCADVPAGMSRYIEVPFAQPNEAGTYLYRAALRVKEKTPWADQGEEIAVSVSRIANLFCEN